MHKLLVRHGLEPLVAPSMRETPLEMNPQIADFCERLLEGRIDVLVFMTGVGATALLEIAAKSFDRQQLLAAMNRVTVVVRGPKPVAVLRNWQVRIDHRVPEPNTWRELLQTLDAEVPVEHRVVAVQEYGVPNLNLYQQLEQRGAEVLAVPVYRWALPEDTGPLEAAVRAIAAGQFDAVVFTSANQWHNVRQIVERLELESPFEAALTGLVIASIGPTCSEALEEAGLQVDVEASPPKMGHLVRQLAQKLSVT